MNKNLSIPRTIAIFASLATAGITIASCAQLVPDAFAQSLMVSTGSAVFGAALAFFLIRITSLIEK